MYSTDNSIIVYVIVYNVMGSCYMLQDHINPYVMYQTCDTMPSADIKIYSVVIKHHLTQVSYMKLYVIIT